MSEAEKAKITRRKYLTYGGGIIVVAVVAAAGYGIYEATRPAPKVEKKALGKILQTHGYRGSTSEVLRASGFLDGSMGKELPVRVVDPVEAAKVRAEREYPDHTKVNLDVRKPFVGYIPLGIYNPWDELNLACFKWYCGEVLGWKYEVAWPDADVKKQNDMAEALIAMGVDALVVCPLDSVANAKIGEMAQKAGIPVALFGIDMYHTWPLVFYQRDDYESGWYCGKYVREKLIEKFGPDIQIGIDILIVDVGNSWDAEAEFPYVRAAMAANPDIVAVFEVMGGYHEAWVRAAKDLGWSEEKIKDITAVDVDFFPVNLDGYIAGYQDYTRMMPTGCYMIGPSLETLKQFWKYGPDALPKIGDTFTVAKYIPELGTRATVEPEGFAPLQWFEDPKWGVSPTEVRASNLVGYSRPWVHIPDRVVDTTNYMEPFIYWNWPIWGYPHRPEILK
mgnify:CR=1 FL=1